MNQIKPTGKLNGNKTQQFPIVTFQQLALCMLLHMPGEISGWTDPHEMCNKSEQTEKEKVKWKSIQPKNCARLNNEGMWQRDD